jgi:hypothetical protein
LTPGRLVCRTGATLRYSLKRHAALLFWLIIPAVAVFPAVPGNPFENTLPNLIPILVILAFMANYYVFRGFQDQPPERSIFFLTMVVSFAYFTASLYLGELNSGLIVGQIAYLFALLVPLRKHASASAIALCLTTPIIPIAIGYGMRQIG